MRNVIFVGAVPARDNHALRAGRRSTLAGCPAARRSRRTPPPARTPSSSHDCRPGRGRPRHAASSMRGRRACFAGRHGEHPPGDRHPRAAAGPARRGPARARASPAPTPETADLFRDKARMKDELRRHGLPCARHRLIRSWPTPSRSSREVGLPLVLKPPAGHGLQGDLAHQLARRAPRRAARAACQPRAARRSPRSSCAAASTASRRSPSAARFGSSRARATTRRRSRSWRRRGSSGWSCCRA